jgi:hypothetical protein
MALEQIERKLYVRWNGRSILHFFQKSSTAEEGTYLNGIVFFTFVPMWLKC